MLGIGGEGERREELETAWMISLACWVSMCLIGFPLAMKCIPLDLDLSLRLFKTPRFKTPRWGVTRFLMLR